MTQQEFDKQEWKKEMKVLNVARNEIVTVKTVGFETGHLVVAMDKKNNYAVHFSQIELIKE